MSHCVPESRDRMSRDPLTLSGRASPTRRAGLSLAALCALALLGGASCRKETPPTETKTEVKPAPPNAETPRKVPRTVDEGVEVPTEEDFEDAVEKQITAESNLQKELDQLEKQIQQP
jgi:hypothetical protein